MQTTKPLKKANFVEVSHGIEAQHYKYHQPVSVRHTTPTYQANDATDAGIRARQVVSWHDFYDV